MHPPEPNLVFALALGAGVVAQLLARHLRLPSIVVLLAVGVLLGPDGLGWIAPRALGEGLFGLVGLAVAVILFEGALNLDLRRLRQEGSAIRMLISLGAVITAVGGAVAARTLMNWPWRLCALFGTLVIVTGPTVIRPLLRNVPLRARLATVLEAESVLIDPIGAIAASVALAVLVRPGGDTLASGVVGLAVRLGFGAAAGLAAGFSLGFVLRRPRLVPEGFENIATLGAVLVLFEGCEAVRSESGILAVTIAGVVVANLETRLHRELREFEEHLSVGLIGLLFVLLAADVRVADVLRLGWRGLATVGALAVLVRPANVAACTLRSGLALRERLFLSWIAPRGIVAAAIASLVAAYMEELGVPGGGELRALVFLAIGATVVVQGATAPLFARVLRVRAPGRDGVVILGAEELGFALGEVLRGEHARVAFVDANPSHCRAAEERGFSVVYGNALDEPTLVRARLDRARAVVGLTANDEVNSLFAREAREDYGVPETYVAINRGEGGVPPRILAKQESRMLFDRPKDVERWNVRIRHGAARVERCGFVGAEPEAEPRRPAEAEPLRPATSGSDPYIVLAVRAAGGEAWTPMHEGLELRPDDVAAVAIHVPEEAQAHAALSRLGFRLLASEA